jgi:hypothetical protein
MGAPIDEQQVGANPFDQRQEIGIDSAEAGSDKILVLETAGEGPEPVSNPPLAVGRSEVGMPEEPVDFMPELLKSCTDREFVQLRVTIPRHEDSHTGRPRYTLPNTGV